MALLIIAGEIDLSVASIIALASIAMGAAARPASARRCWCDRHCRRARLRRLQRLRSSPGFGLPSIVVTIGTMSLFRGIAYVVLGDQAYRNYPPGFAFFGQGYLRY